MVQRGKSPKSWSFESLWLNPGDLLRCFLTGGEFTQKGTFLNVTQLMAKTKVKGRACIVRKVFTVLHIAPRTHAAYS